MGKLTVAAALAASFGLSTMRAAFADVAPASNGSSATAMTYSVDLDLAYRDVLGAGKSGGSTSAADAASDGTESTGSTRETPRGLGLSKFRAALEWQHQGASALTVVLRPDAMNRGLFKKSAAADAAAEPRDDDSRAGSTYAQRPTIRLLDAYQATLFPGSSFATSVGVFENLAPIRASYPEILDFGLRAELPATFGALRLRWQGQRATPDRPEPSNVGRFVIDSYAIQGDGDRVEATGTKRHSFDAAPVAADPYYGGALYVGFYPGMGLELGLLAGMQDAVDESGATKSGNFAEIVVVEDGIGARFPTKVSLDIRRVGERFRGAAPAPSPRTQQSIGLSASSQVGAGIWYLLGADYGSSDRMLDGGTADQIDVFRGWQVETGVMGAVGRDLSLEMLVSQESRTEKGPGQVQRGGFVDGTGDQKSLRRLALTLSYNLDDKN